MKKTTHTLILAILLCQSASFLFAQKNTDILTQAVATLRDDAALAHGQVGICISDASGNVLAANNADMSLIPASNMKVVTTLAALHLLGSDYRFKTQLQYEGEIRDSTLFGNLIIRGGGDPTLGSPEMDSVLSFSNLLDLFAQKIRDLGIKKIEGSIVGDGTAFESQTAVPTWLYEDLGNYYGAGANGLTIHENMFYLRFWQNPIVGAAPTIFDTYPTCPDLKILSEVTSNNNAGDDAYVYEMPYAPYAVVRGSIPAGNREFSIKATMPDPPLAAAWHLRQRLEWLGVPVRDSASTMLQRIQQNKNTTTTTNGVKTTFYTHLSPILAKIVEQTNQESVNLYAETLLKAMAMAKTGQGSTDEGIKIVKSFWAEKGISTAGLFMQDGSGLSPRNGVTPRQLNQMLRVALRDTVVFSPFYASLPRAGESGTMRSMLKKTPAVGRLRAKSGTITRVKTYSGYVTQSDGSYLIFAVMLNNFDATQKDIRQKLERFMLSLCAY